MTDRTVVYGVSDDLLEVEGPLRDEFTNGVVLKMTCDDEGIWRIFPRACYRKVQVVFARGEDEGNDEDGCPGYSDKAIISEAVSWVVVGTEWAFA